MVILIVRYCCMSIKVGEQLPHRFLEDERCSLCCSDLYPWELPSMSMSIVTHGTSAYLASPLGIGENNTTNSVFLQGNGVEAAPPPERR